MVYETFSEVVAELKADVQQARDMGSPTSSGRYSLVVDLQMIMLLPDEGDAHELPLQVCWLNEVDHCTRLSGHPAADSRMQY